MLTRYYTASDASAPGTYSRARSVRRAHARPHGARRLVPSVSCGHTCVLLVTVDSRGLYADCTKVQEVTASTRFNFKRSSFENALAGAGRIASYQFEVFMLQYQNNNS